MNKSIVRAVLVLVAVAAIGWYAVSRPVGANAAVALVNGTAITRGQLTTLESQIAAQQGLSATSTTARTQFESAALDTLIGQTLLKQAAVRSGIVASSTQVNAQVSAARASFSTKDEYEKALAARGLTEADLQTQISENFIINEYLEKQLVLSAATATDAEIKTVYDQLSSRQTSSPTPPLSQVRSQVAQMVIRQKQQAAVSAFVAQLRKTANIKILIATSTPAA